MSGLPFSCSFRNKCVRSWRLRITQEDEVTRSGRCNYPLFVFWPCGNRNSSTCCLDVKAFCGVCYGRDCFPLPSITTKEACESQQFCVTPRSVVRPRRVLMIPQQISAEDCLKEQTDCSSRCPKKDPNEMGFCQSSTGVHSVCRLNASVEQCKVIGRDYHVNYSNGYCWMLNPPPYICNLDGTGEFLRDLLPRFMRCALLAPNFCTNCTGGRCPNPPAALIGNHLMQCSVPSRRRECIGEQECKAFGGKCSDELDLFGEDLDLRDPLPRCVYPINPFNLPRCNEIQSHWFSSRTLR
eukprot:TRINITY_DN12742_c0_g1_i1.p1 TRINITY_DN12742_c0_g1~~TRINITY_DN12742_c0_g1_i1.p1  ORF type:complete len:320 (-),score=41.69 TRINITY_DN12742_c0_g1_i1:46-933(-)